MSIVIITGSNGLVGSEAVNFFSKKGFKVIGIDNNLREFFFGSDGSTFWLKKKIIKENPNYKHFNTDIRNYRNLEKIFKIYKKNISLIIHCAAQPSHDTYPPSRLVHYLKPCNRHILQKQLLPYPALVEVRA